MVMSVISKDDHIKVITKYLAGKKVLDILLWEAVGYFQYGRGKNLPKPCTDEEWLKLLKETHHDEDDESK